MTRYVYLLEESTNVENEFVPVRAYRDEALADHVAARNNVNTRGILYVVHEVELVE